MEVGHLSREKQLELLSIARQQSEKSGLSPDFSCGLRHQSWHGYYPYIGGLRLWDGKNLQALEKISPLIASLATPSNSAWLIYPREINQNLKKELSLLVEDHEYNIK